MQITLQLDSVCPPIAQAALIDMIYRKALTMTSAAKGRFGVGTIINMQSNDAYKLWSMVLFLHSVWYGPLQVGDRPSRSSLLASLYPRVSHPLSLYPILSSQMLSVVFWKRKGGSCGARCSPHCTAYALGLLQAGDRLPACLPAVSGHLVRLFCPIKYRRLATD